MSPAHERAFRGGIGIGIALAVLGVVSYVVTDFASVTALIPAIFGVFFVGLGRFGLESDRDRLAVYGLGALALLGLAGTARGVSDVMALLTGAEVDSAAAAASQGLFALGCLVLLGLIALAVLEDRGAP